MSNIDIIIPWVDGSDPLWRQAFEEARGTRAKNPPPSPSGSPADLPVSSTACSASSSSDDGVVAVGGGENDSDIRYRDWGTLPYLFRGIERLAPWVRRIHFVTWGHLPEWLDLSNPRLNVVKHSDFIPAEYLPVFASRPIELNVHRIAGLAERFILFNDDMFLCRPVPPERFFRDGLPCDMARLSLIAPSSISHTVLNMTEILARRHDRRTVMRLHPHKWFSPRYGLSNLLKTLDLSVWRGWSGLADSHMPQPYLRTVFERMWAQEHDILDATCRQRFRSPFGVNHWLMRYEQLATGGFSPVSLSDTRLDTLTEDRIGEIESYIRSRSYSMICLGDTPLLRDFASVRDRLVAAFEDIFPEKSSFEV
jgi:hypothetical protein